MQRHRHIPIDADLLQPDASVAALVDHRPDEVGGAVRRLVPKLHAKRLGALRAECAGDPKGEFPQFRHGEAGLQVWILALCQSRCTSVSSASITRKSRGYRP